MKWLKMSEWVMLNDLYLANWVYFLHNAFIIYGILLELWHHGIAVNKKTSCWIFLSFSLNNCTKTKKCHTTTNDVYVHTHISHLRFSCGNLWCGGGKWNKRWRKFSHLLMHDDLGKFYSKLSYLFFLLVWW